MYDNSMIDMQENKFLLPDYNNQRILKVIVLRVCLRV